MYNLYNSHCSLIFSICLSECHPWRSNVFNFNICRIYIYWHIFAFWCIYWICLIYFIRWAIKSFEQLFYQLFSVICYIHNGMLNPIWIMWSLWSKICVKWRLGNKSMVSLKTLIFNSCLCLCIRVSSAEGVFFFKNDRYRNSSSMFPSDFAWELSSV